MRVHAVLLVKRSHLNVTLRNKMDILDFVEEQKFRTIELQIFLYSIFYEVLLIY